MLAVGTNSVPIWWGAFNPNPSQHGPAGAIAVGGGFYNDYVIGSDTGLWVWGDDSYGQYGNNTQYQNQPGTVRDTVDQSSAYEGVAVASGGSHALLLRNDGTVWAWGDNSVGELGDGAANSFPVLIPAQVRKSNNIGDYLTGVVQVAAGGGGLGEPYSMALTSDGTIWVWGSDHEGQLGNGLTNQNVLWATALTTITGVVAIAAAPDGVNSMALKSDGTVWTWGRNNLGNGSTAGSSTPVEVSSLSGVAAISVSYSHAIVAKNDGTVWNWGDNAFGEMDNGTTSSMPVLMPIQANSVSGATEVAAGDYYSEVLLSSGTVWGWGTNENYELGTGFMTTPYTFPVQANLPATVAQPAPCPTLGVGQGPNPGPAAAEMLGSGPIDELSVAPNCCQGVTPAIGNFWDTSVDLLVPGRGVSLDLSRTYNSLLESQNGPLGFGWTFSYNVFLSFDSSGNPTVHEENGATIPFNLVGGVYQAPSRVLASLVKNGDGTYTLNRRFQVHLKFNANGQLISLTDRNNYTTLLHYNASQQVDTVTDATLPTGRTFTLAYTNGLLTSVTDSSTPARKVQYGYDASGNLGQVTDINGGITIYTYDNQHGMKTIEDPRQHTRGISIDSFGRVSQELDANNFASGLNPTVFSYGVNTTLITYPAGNQWFEQYQNNALVGRTEAYGTAEAVTWAYSYDSTTLGISSVVDPESHAASNTWYPTGYVHTSSDALGHTVTYTYDSLNDILTSKDALPSPKTTTTTYTYDANGNVKTITTPLLGTTQSQVTTYAYGDSSHLGDVTSITDPVQKAWTFTYDTYGDRATAVDPASDTTYYCYNDTIGQLSWINAPNAHQTCQFSNSFMTSFGANPFGDRTYVNDPRNDKTTFIYDADRNLYQVIDARNFTTQFDYDADNRRTTTTQDAGTQSAIQEITGYDLNGNVISEQDGRGNRSVFKYDALDHRRIAQDPLAAASNTYAAGFGYDPMGQVTSVESPNGPTTVLGYDAAGRLTNVYYFGGGTHNVIYGYDEDNQRSSMADGTGTTVYTIDSLHRLTKVTDGSGQAVSYGYDLKNQLTSIIYPGGSHTVTRVYDGAGRLHTVTDWLKHTTTFNYDNDSNLIQIQYPNGITANLTPDTADRLGTVSDVNGKGQNIQGFPFTYGRDNDGNLCNVGGQACMPGSMGPYDPFSRQTTVATVPNTYSYDASGNLYQINISPYSTTLTFDAAEQAATLTKTNNGTLVQKLTYTFDLNGNRKQQTDQNGAATTYAYDQANRLIRYGTATTSATYAYNGDGQRTKKTVGSSVTSFVWNSAQSTSAPLYDGSSSYITGFGGMPLELVTSSGAAYYYHQDQLGSTADLTDSRGSVVDSYNYDSYGNVTSSSGSVANPLKFAGQYTDAESGLQYLGARYYEPSSGLFLTRDPAGQGQNSPYSYSADSPQNATDPSGFGPDWLAGLNALKAGSADIGRQYLAASLTGAANWVGWEHDSLASGDPLRVAEGVLGVGVAVVAVAGLFVPFLGEAEVGADAAAIDAETDGELVSVYHGSLNDSTSILENGLDASRSANVSRDIRAAQDAIGPNRIAVSGPGRDPGIIESRIPRAEFDRVLRPSEREYHGFYPYPLKDSTEIVLQTQEQFDLFNRYIVGLAG